MVKIPFIFRQGSHHYAIFSIAFDLFLHQQVYAEQLRGPFIEHFDFRQITPAISKEKE
jgi:hypothetical protein